MVFKAYLYSDGFGGFLWKKDGNGIFVGMDIHSYCNYSNGNKQKIKIEASLLKGVSGVLGRKKLLWVVSHMV